MLTTFQKIGMAAFLFIACAVLALVSFSAGWENMPDSQKEIAIISGYSLCAFLAISAAVYSVWFVITTKQEEFIKEMTGYNQRMENQFNVGQVVKPKENYIDRSDYLRLSKGSK